MNAVHNTAERKNSKNESPLSVSWIANEGLAMVACHSGHTTAFAGVADSHTFQEVITDHKTELLLRAVNNRTRERNYFRLYAEMLMGDVSEEQFNEELEKHTEHYVAEEAKPAETGEIETALQLSEKIIDVKDVDDMADVFSLDYNSVMKHIAEK